jgi:GntR family transcriptional regulator
MTGARFAELAQAVRERIALGEFSGSGALESEATLGRRYEASRVTVRRALEQLRSEGLVESRRGAGWFVTAGAYHQRLALGTFRHAPSIITDQGGQVRRSVVAFGYEPVPAPFAGGLGLAEGDDVLRSRCVRLVDGVPLDVVTEWVPARLAGSLSRDDAERAGIWQTLQRLGHEVATVRQSITAGLTSDSDADLLQTTPGTPVLLVRRLALAADEMPIALSDHRYLAHRFSLEVEFRGWQAASAAEPPGLHQIDSSP